MTIIHFAEERAEIYLAFLQVVHYHLVLDFLRYLEVDHQEVLDLQGVVHLEKLVPVEAVQLVAVHRLEESKNSIWLLVDCVLCRNTYRK